MAGKHLPPPFLHRRFRSPVVLFPLLLLLLLLFAYLFFSSLSASSCDPAPPASHSAKPETSFLVSLERFLAHRSSSALSRHLDDTASPAVDGGGGGGVGKFDDSVFASESERLRGDPLYPLDLPLRVPSISPPVEAPCIASSSRNEKTKLLFCTTGILLRSISAM
ncbi:hypothetical protein NL676_028614 [Syzygium grande]|nr:hypothetical protein NL676_028614 [Syzygium grande]